MDDKILTDPVAEKQFFNDLNLLYTAAWKAAADQKERDQLMWAEGRIGGYVARLKRAANG